MPAGNVIGHREREAIADVERTVPVKEAWIAAIRRNEEPVPVARRFIQRMRPGVPREEGKSMARALRQCRLQRVVVGKVIVADVCDLAQIRELAEKRPRGLCVGGAERRLIDVAQAQKFCAVRPNVGDLQRKIIRERLLQVQSPGADVRRAQIAIGGFNVARRRIGDRTTTRRCKRQTVSAGHRPNTGRNNWSAIGVE